MSETGEFQEQEEITQEETPHEPDPQIVERAKMRGWVPKEEFRGDESRWRSAEEFLNIADNMMPLLKADNQKLESQVTDLTRKLTSTQDMVKKMVKIQSKYTDDYYDSQINEIKTQKLKAVEDGDLDLYKRLEEKEASISRPETETERPEPEDRTIDTSLHPDVARWKEKNESWYGADTELTEYADIIASRMSAQGHSYTPAQFCEEVEKKVKTMFSEKFRNTSQQKPSLDEASLRGSDLPYGTKSKGWNDLPVDAKQQCNKLIAEIPGYSKEKYLKDYYEGE